MYKLRKCVLNPSLTKGGCGVVSIVWSVWIVCLSSLTD